MLEISKHYNKGQFKFENAVISALADYEGQYEKSRIREVSNGLWQVSYHYRDNKPFRYYQLERTRCSIKNEISVISVKTKKGLIFLHEVKL